MMRFTPRRAGHHMANVYISYTVGSYEIAYLLCRFARTYNVGGPDVFNDEPGRDMTRAQVDELVRRALYGWGSEAYGGEEGWDENYNNAQTAIIVAWAVAQIRRLFPALDDARLAEFEHDWTPPPKKTATDDDTEEGTP